MMNLTGKSYVVKDWLANKIANELKRNISACRVFAVLKETDKAIYAILDLGYKSYITKWIPKSALIISEANSVSEHGRVSHETYTCDDYDEAIRELKYTWRAYE